MLLYRPYLQYTLRNIRLPEALRCGAVLSLTDSLLISVGSKS